MARATYHGVAMADDNHHDRRTDVTPERRTVLTAVGAGLGLGAVGSAAGSGADDSDDTRADGHDDEDRGADDRGADDRDRGGDDEAWVAVLSDTDADAESEASGCVHFEGEDGELAFHVVLEDIEDVTQAHIHEGGRDETGPIVVGLLAYNTELDGTGEGETRSAAPDAPIVDSGTIDDEDAVAAVQENPSGYYVNVHTAANPAGEIRGQIRSTATDDGDDEMADDDH